MNSTSRIISELTKMAAQTEMNLKGEIQKISSDELAALADEISAKPMTIESAAQEAIGAEKARATEEIVQNVVAEAASDAAAIISESVKPQLTEEIVQDVAAELGAGASVAADPSMEGQATPDAVDPTQAATTDEIVGGDAAGVSEKVATVIEIFKVAAAQEAAAIEDQIVKEAAAQFIEEDTKAYYALEKLATESLIQEMEEQQLMKQAGISMGFAIAEEILKEAGFDIKTWVKGKVGSEEATEAIMKNASALAVIDDTSVLEAVDTLLTESGFNK